MIHNAFDFQKHGGAIDAARRAFPSAPLPWLDLSTGINPVAYPIGSIAEDAWTRLPDATALAALEAAAAQRYGAPVHAGVVAAPGTQAIIQRLPAICGDDVRVLGPTYGEFQRVFRDAGAGVRVVPTFQALAGADAAIVVNPNNPDGRLIDPEDLLVLGRRVGTLVIDEAFADVMPGSSSLVPRLPASGTIVLRSFGKLYGLAGVRLGFAVAAASQAEALRRMLGPWPVSGPAIAIGTEALADTGWLDNTRRRLASDGARLLFLLRHVGAAPIGGTALFRLFEHPAAPALFTALAKRGILTRPFADEPTWLRFGLPGAETDWIRLQTALLPFR